MNADRLLEQYREAISQIASHREDRQAIANSRVKAWKTEVEHLLKLGGKNTSKLLQTFQALKFGASSGGETTLTSNVKFQTYQAELDTAEKLLKNAIQTIQIFGITEEQKLPDWFKQEAKASGNVKVGGRDIDIKTITIAELLQAVAVLAESDKSLDESLKSEIRDQLGKLQKHPLLQPFLQTTLDRLLPRL